MWGVSGCALPTESLHRILGVLHRVLGVLQTVLEVPHRVLVVQVMIEKGTSIWCVGLCLMAR